MRVRLCGVCVRARARVHVRVIARIVETPIVGKIPTRGTDVARGNICGHFQGFKGHVGFWLTLGLQKIPSWMHDVLGLFVSNDPDRILLVQNADMNRYCSKSLRAIRPNVGKSVHFRRRPTLNTQRVDPRRPDTCRCVITCLPSSSFLHPSSPHSPFGVSRMG